MEIVAISLSELRMSIINEGKTNRSLSKTR